MSILSKLRKHGPETAASQDIAPILTGNRFIAWLQRRFNSNAVVFVLASIVGVVTGICAALFKLAIDSLTKVVQASLVGHHHNWHLLIVPLIGFMLAWAFQRFVIKQRISHGVNIIADNIKRHVFQLRKCLTYAWMVAGTLTLGFGGSAGSEGPIASTGAAIGSFLAQKCKLSPNLMRILIGCGAGAGIAAIFKAPVGGFLFTLEVLRLEFGTLSVMALLTACIIAALVAYMLSGFTVDISFLQIEQFQPESIPWILALGVFCGLYSLYYSTVMKTLERLFKKIRSSWLTSAVAAIAVGVMLFLVPALYGEGYGVMQLVLNGHTDVLTTHSPLAFGEGSGWHLALFCLVIVLLKAAAASATTTGGVAGDFAPTLFAGCILGLLFATVANTWLGSEIPAGAFAFMGMAGVMAGVIRAPFMAIFLTAEMCNGFIMLLPLAIVAAISCATVRMFQPPRLYTTLWGGA